MDTNTSQILYRNPAKWTILDYLLIILFIAGLFVGVLAIYYSFLFFSPIFSGSYNLINFIFITALIILALLLTFRSVQYGIPWYQFIIFKNGFVYGYRLEGTKINDNFLDYTRIKNVQFCLYGFVIRFELIDSTTIKIRDSDDRIFYRKITKELIKRFKIVNVPDMELVYELNQYDDESPEFLQRFKHIMTVNARFK